MSKRNVNKEINQWIIDYKGVILPYYGDNNTILKIKESIMKVNNIFKRCKIM